MVRKSTLVGFALLVILGTGCTKQSRQVSFVRPKGYPAPHSLAASKDLDWQRKADLAIEVADDEALAQAALEKKAEEKLIAEVKAPMIQKSLFLWVSQESKSAPRHTIALREKHGKHL
jgi:hypothetical protein